MRGDCRYEKVTRVITSFRQHVSIIHVGQGDRNFIDITGVNGIRRFAVVSVAKTDTEVKSLRVGQRKRARATSVYNATRHDRRTSTAITTHSNLSDAPAATKLSRD